MYSLFLVTSDHYQERNALSEAYNFLLQFVSNNNISVYAKTLLIRGLGLLEFKNFSIHFPDNIETIMKDFSKKITYCSKIIPLNGIITTPDFGELLPQMILELTKDMTDEESWRITVQKRHSKIKEKDLIALIANKITVGKVNLTNPDWIVQIEVLQNWIAYSILRPSHYLSFARQKKLLLLTDSEAYKYSFVDE